MSTTKDPLAHITKKLEKRTAHQITADPLVQRPLDKRRVNRIVDLWNAAAFGVPTVSQRGDGTCVALDGQHRIEAKRQRGEGSERFDVVVFYGLDLQQEARMFSALNDTKRPTTLELFQVKVTEGDATICACNALLHKYGLRASGSLFSGVAALVEAFERDEHSTEQALITATRAWGVRRASCDSRLFRGLSKLYYRYDESVDLEHLVEKLRKGPSTDPDSMIGRARANSKIRSLAFPDAVADVLVGVYNYDKKTKKLPTWEN